MPAEQDQQDAAGREQAEPNARQDALRVDEFTGDRADRARYVRGDAAGGRGSDPRVGREAELRHTGEREAEHHGGDERLTWAERPQTAVPYRWIGPDPVRGGEPRGPDLDRQAFTLR